MKFFNKKISLKDLEETKKTDKIILKLDKEREKINIKFDSAPSGTIEKGEYLLEFIRLTEERLKIKSTMSDRNGLRILKAMYKKGLIFGKWKKRPEIQWKKIREMLNT